MNVLTVGAHPADVFDLAGGTVANFATGGHRVYLGVITHGSFSHTQTITDRPPEALAQCKTLKREECETAARHVGLAGIRYFDYDDEPFLPTRDAILALAEYVREVRPDVVITHHPNEYGHPDHPVVGDMVLRSLKAAERWLQGSLRPAHPMRRVYFFGTQFRAISTKLAFSAVGADFIVDITPSIEKKKRAVAAFASQSFKGAQYDEAWADRRVQRVEGHWGFMNGLEFAEEFICLTPQTVKLLP